MVVSATAVLIKSMVIERSIFRAYDIRGIVDKNFDAATAYTIARAFASCYPQLRHVALARDGRLSGAAISTALAAGLNASGIAVIDVGQVPTPLLYYAACRNTGSGLMVTGSHNPAEYNGIKIMVAGTTLADDKITDIYDACVHQHFRDGDGRLDKIDYSDDYIAALTDDIHLARPLRVGVDCGNGVAGPILLRLLSALGCESEALYCDIDGRFPNHHPNPSDDDNLKDLIALVTNQALDLGIALDGDGDRLGVIDNTGKIIRSDRQMMLYARSVLSQHPGATIIYDVKSSQHLPQLIKDEHGVPCMCRTGHSFVKAALKETGALLAGEMSGHIFFNDRWFGFDDALYAAARMLEIIASGEQTCSERFAALPDSISTPEMNVHFNQEEQQFRFMEQFAKVAQFPAAVIRRIDGLRVEYNDGWGLVRASNTTPSLVLRFEADNHRSMQRIQSLFRSQMLKVDATLNLPF